MEVDIPAAITSVPHWRHRIRLPDGTTTPGSQDTNLQLSRIDLPQDLNEKTVLDIGCSDGFFSFECERRGAKRVLAVDDFSSVFVDTPEGFFVAHKALNSKVEFRQADLLDLSPDTIGRFDIVLFLGVLYHLRHPLLGLERAADLCAPGGLVIVESEILRPFDDLMERTLGAFSRKLYMQFVEDEQINRDPTNWWIPSRSCVMAMMRSSGLERVSVRWRCRSRATFHGYVPAGMTAAEARAIKQREAEERAKKWHQGERWR